MAGKEKALNQITSEREGKQKQPASFNDFVKFGKKYARKGKYKRAIQSFGQASKIGTDDFKARTALVAEVGLCYVGLNQYDLALKQFKTQLSLAKKLSDPLETSNAFGNLAMACQGLNQIAKATDCVQKRVGYARTSQNKGALAAALDDLGQLYHTLAQSCHSEGGAASKPELFNASVAYYCKGLAQRDKQNDPSGVANSAANLAQVYELNGNHTRALFFYQKSLTIAETGTDVQLVSRTLGQLGTVCRAMGDYSKAIEYFERDLATSQEREDRYNEGIAHRNLGGAYQAYGDFKQSVQHHEQHLAIMLEISNQADFPAAHENLGRLYERLLDYRKAADHYKSTLVSAQDSGDEIMERRSRDNILRVTRALEQGSSIPIESNENRHTAPLRGTMRTKQMTQFIRNSFRRPHTLQGKEWVGGASAFDVELGAMGKNAKIQEPTSRARAATATRSRKSVLAVFGERTQSLRFGRKGSPRTERSSKGKTVLRKSAAAAQAIPDIQTTNLDELEAASLVEALGDIDKLVTPQASPRPGRAQSSLPASELAPTLSFVPLDEPDYVGTTSFSSREKPSSFSAVSLVQTQSQTHLLTAETAIASLPFSSNQQSANPPVIKAKPRQTISFSPVSLVTSEPAPQDHVPEERALVLGPPSSASADSKTSASLSQLQDTASTATKGAPPERLAHPLATGPVHPLDAEQQVQPSVAPQAVIGKARSFVALYNHDNDQDDDLLQFQKGDILKGMKRVNDGWYFGKHVTTGKTGLIPFNYVKQQDEVAKDNESET